MDKGILIDTAIWFILNEFTNGMIQWWYKKLHLMSIILFIQEHRNSIYKGKKL